MGGAPGLREFEEFLFHEARCLDEGRFEDWLDLFTDDGWYWVPSQPDQENPQDTVSLIYDDRMLLETRVRRLSRPGAHTQSPPPRTSRIIGNVTVEEADATADAWLIASRFQMVEHRRDRQRVFAGACRHRLERHDGHFRIRWKRVDLVNCDGMMEGLTVPF